MKYTIQIKKIALRNNEMEISFTGMTEVKSEVAHPKIILHFVQGKQDRRIPLVIQHSFIHQGICFFGGTFSYDLPHIFFQKGQCASMEMYMNVLFEDYYEEKVPLDLTPEVWERSFNAYDAKVCGNHLLIQKNGRRVAPSPGKAGSATIFFYWLFFVIGIVLSPVFLLEAVLAEAKLFPYKLPYIESGKTPLKRILRQYNENLMQFSHRKISFRGIKIRVLRLLYFLAKCKKVDARTISLMSVRRDELSGNLAFVYEKLKEREDIRIRQFLCPKDIAGMNLRELCRIAEICATSKVIVLDEYTAYMYRICLRPETKLIQLWHACGAFKTFGYTRLGKPGGTQQESSTHRNYDYVAVSSESVRIWYAEGFGIPTSHVIATGVPRTDIFFDAVYRENVRKRLYETYPVLKGRKVILFAPTFRGENRLNAEYPMERFDVGHFLDHIPEEYVMLIKHHPFVRKKHPVPEKYADRVLDLSGSSELNDLLFITDIVITDYSSLVFEASLLNLPMLFYTFDLKEYIDSRDFYFNFETFVPGRFVYEQEELEAAVCHKDFEQEKVRDFAEKFFDARDGRASERVADLILHALEE